MSENKTQPTQQSVEDFINSVPDERRRNEAQTLRALMERISGEPAVMWGPSMIGFGSEHYRYETGREGDIFVVGFSPRKAALSLYGMLGVFSEHPELFEELGPYRAGKGCLYLKRLTDVNVSILEKIITHVIEKRQEKTD